MSFDPYYKWLGIPPEEQPADHYRLLGIRRFEKDLEVIDAAADRQLTFLHEITNGELSHHAEELSNQVSAARICLTNAVKKKRYDQSLRSTSAASPGVQQSASGGPVGAASPRSVLGIPPGVASSAATGGSGNGVLPGGWHLRHADGVVHGPFALDDLVDAARLGRISSQTQLRHPTVTGDQWIQAMSVPEISSGITRAAWGAANAARPANGSPTTASPSSGSAHAASAVKVRTRERSKRSGARSLMVIAASVLPVLMSLAVFAFVFSNPDHLARLASLLGLNSAPPEKQVRVRIEKPKRQPLEIPDPLEKVDRQTTQTTPEDSTSTQQGPPMPSDASVPSVFGHGRPLGENPRPLLPGAFDVDQVEKDAVKIDVKLSSSRWNEPIPDASVDDEFFLVKVEDSPGRVTMKPATGQLSFDSETEVLFGELQGLRIILKLVMDDDSGEVSLNGQIMADEKIPFRFTNLKKRHKAAKDSYTRSATQLQFMNKTHAQAQDIVNAPGGRPLAVVGEAKRRLVTLRRQIPEVQRMVQSQQIAVQNMNVLMEKVNTLEENSRFVVLARESSAASTDTADQ